MKHPDGRLIECMALSRADVETTAQAVCAGQEEPFLRDGQRVRLIILDGMAILGLAP